MIPDSCTNARELFDDPVAVAALRRRLLRYAERSLSEADAEDVTQETLLALLGAFDRYCGTAQFHTYAHAVLRHKTIDVYRAHGKELPYAPEALKAVIDRATEMEFDSDPESDPAVRIDAQRQTEQIWSTLAVCLRDLPKRTRAVFELRALLELDLPVVCQHLGITSNHAGVLAHRARAHIRRRWPAAHSPERATALT